MISAHTLGSLIDHTCMKKAAQDCAVSTQRGCQREQRIVSHIFDCTAPWHLAKQHNCNVRFTAYKGKHDGRAKYGDQFCSSYCNSMSSATHSSCNIAAKDGCWPSSSVSSHKTATPSTAQRRSNPLGNNNSRYCIKRAGPLTPRAHGIGNGYASRLDQADWRLQSPEMQITAGQNPAGHQLNGKAASFKRSDPLEKLIEQAIFNCRFFTLMAVVGSLAGSLLCFFQGCVLVMESFLEYFHASLHSIDTGHVIFLLVEAIDIYLVGTVMLIFGMGVYELFVNTIGVPKDNATSKRNYTGSNLFGLFRLQERPLWLEIRSLDELKTKLGHVIVMILLVGMFEKSKKVPIGTGLDLLCFSASILMSSGCLFLLSKLHLVK